MSTTYGMAMLKVADFVRESRRFLSVAYEYEEARHLDKSDPSRVLLADESAERR